MHAWALEGDLDTTKIRSNTFKMLWPPRSNTMQEFPEVDRAEFFSPAVAREKVNPAQVAFHRSARTISQWRIATLAVIE